MEKFNLNNIIKNIVNNQKGGDDSISLLRKEIEDIAKSASKINLYKNLLEKKLKNVNKLDITPISNILTKLETDLKSMREKINVDLSVDKELILNQVQTIDRFILNADDPAITINLERTPKMIQVPLNSDELTVGVSDSLDILVKETDTFRDMIDGKLKSSDEDFLSKKELLTSSLESLRLKNENLLRNIGIVKVEYEKLETYKNINELEILPSYFKISEPSDIDSIELEKLKEDTSASLNLTNPDIIQNLNVEEIYQDEIGKKISNAEEIINPDILKLSQLGGNISPKITETNNLFIQFYNKIKENMLNQEEILQKTSAERERIIEQEKTRMRVVERQRQREIKKERELLLLSNYRKEIDDISQILATTKKYNDRDLNITNINTEISSLQSKLRELNTDLNRLNRSLRTTKVEPALSNLQKSIKLKEKSFKGIEKQIEEKENFKKIIPRIKSLKLREPELKRRLAELIELEKEQSQKVGEMRGGSWDSYNSTIIKLYKLINELRLNINEFRKIAMKFNLRYIQFYYHQYFVITYLNLIFFRKNYVILKYVSRGLVSFYLSICEDIYKKMNNNYQKSASVKNNKIIGYFFKYHYMTIAILKSFLKQLYESWDNVLLPSLLDAGKVNNYKFIMKNNLPYSNNLQKGILLLDIFKNILDNYYTYQAPAVAVYLRINDFGEIPIKVFKKSTNNRSKFDHTYLPNCNIFPSGETKMKLDGYKENIKDIEFKEIYDPEGFKDNATLANYMGVPSFLTDNRSIMMITYGYSGVGKTFTLFGDKENKGVLQNSIMGIQGTEKILCRCFEIYGKALPYKSYWSNKTPNDYNHQIHVYNLSNFQNVTESETITNNFDNYLMNTKGTNDKTYYLISPEQVNNFSSVVDNIDKIRINTGRIKNTINNPVSSRSIMMYEFKLILRGNKVSRFIVMDLPGKEDVISSYVNNKKVGYCIKFKPEFEKYNRILRAAIFVNPLLIALFPEITQYILKNYKSYLDKLTLSKRESTLSVVTINEFNIVSTSVNINLKSKIVEITKAIEILKILIDENKIDELEKIYNTVLENETITVDSIEKTCSSVNSSSLPFEAFYINENISGLIKVLAERLYQGEDQKEKRDELLSKFGYMGNFYSENMPVGDTYNQIKKGSSTSNVGNFTLFRDITDPTIKADVNRLIPNFSAQLETRSQVYFIRELLKSRNIKYNTTNYSILEINTTDNSIKNNLTSDDIYQGGLYESNNNVKTIQQWVENSYDFNKIYSEEPPIKTFLQSYFGNENTPAGQPVKKIIDNFYLFFVVSNNNINKCGNQIKLINDSKLFIDVLSNY